MSDALGLPRRIMIDGENLMLPHGTGIATYSRQITGFLADRGAALDVVVDSAFSPSATDAADNRRRFVTSDGLGEGGLFGADRRQQWSGILARPLGARLAPVWTAPVALGDSPLARVSFADRCFAVRRLHDGARQHAIRWGRPMPLTMADGDKPDLFHAMQILAARVAGRPLVVTIHDIIPLMLKGSSNGNMRHYRQVVEAILRHADHVVTVSEHSRQDLIRHLGGDGRRITNTYQSVSVDPAMVARSRAEGAADLAHYGLEPGAYFMYLGAIEPKKNVKRLVEALAASGSQRTLAIVGNLGWNFEEDLAAINDDRFIRYRQSGSFLQQDRQVRRLSFVPREQLISLIRGARALLFPSLYEGFGLPVAEAMHLGTPVMTSTTTSVGEIAGDAALTVDPNDAFAMARAIRRLDQDDDLCAELARLGPLRAELFSPARHRERLEAVYRQVLG
jgi:glycosyltransferase involved in cell wall biosynthesis